MTTVENIIKGIYDNASEPSAFSGAQKIYLALKQNGRDKVGIHKIRKWLQTQDYYSLMKPVRRHFKRAKVVVSGRNEQLDIDLADMQSLSKRNDNIKYLLVAIDVFSRYAWVRPLKDKTSKEVTKALLEILKHVKPKKIRSDGGAEFQNKLIKNVFSDNQIYHHTSLNEVKANYVERFNKTLKTMIYRYMAKYRSDRYIDILQDLVKSYNKTPHRSLGNIAPNDVNKKNEANLWAYMYLKPNIKKNKKVNGSKRKGKKKIKQLYKYKIGQIVRISHQRGPFTRVYNEQWSYEVFKISRRFQIQYLPLYRLVDMLEAPVL